MNTYSGDPEYDNGVEEMYQRIVDILLRKSNLDEGESLEEFDDLVEEYK